MRILIDTHIVIWAIRGHHVSREAKRLIASADAVYVSAASVFEIAMKAAKLKMKIVGLLGQLQQAHFRRLPVTWEHAARAHDFDGHPDPFDRMLVAQADIEPLHLVTVDEKLAKLSKMVVVVH